MESFRVVSCIAQGGHASLMPTPESIAGVRDSDGDEHIYREVYGQGFKCVRVHPKLVKATGTRLIGGRPVHPNHTDGEHRHRPITLGESVLVRSLKGMCREDRYDRKVHRVRSQKAVAAISDMGDRHLPHLVLMHHEGCSVIPLDARSKEHAEGRIGEEWVLDAEKAKLAHRSGAKFTPVGWGYVKDMGRSLYIMLRETHIR